MKLFLILFTLLFSQVVFLQNNDSLKKINSNSKKIDKYLSKIRKGVVLYEKEQVKGGSTYNEIENINKYLKQSKDAQNAHSCLKEFISEFDKNAADQNVKPDNSFLTSKDIDFLINPDFKEEPLVAFLALVSSVESRKNNMLDKMKSRN